MRACLSRDEGGSARARRRPTSGAPPPAFRRSRPGWGLEPAATTWHLAGAGSRARGNDMASRRRGVSSPRQRHGTSTAWGLEPAATTWRLAGVGSRARGNDMASRRGRVSSPRQRHGISPGWGLEPAATTWHRAGVGSRAHGNDMASRRGALFPERAPGKKGETSLALREQGREVRVETNDIHQRGDAVMAQGILSPGPGRIQTTPWRPENRQQGTNGAPAQPAKPRESRPGGRLRNRGRAGGGSWSRIPGCAKQSPRAMMASGRKSKAIHDEANA